MELIYNIGAINNGIKIIKYIWSERDKNQIIDAFSTIIRLAIMSYKPIGTKICIANNKLYIQNPNIFQGTIRKINGDNKDDIFNLIFSIENGCRLYLREKNEKIKWIFEKAKIGIINLKETYNEYGKIVSRLDDYIKIIDEYMTKYDINIEKKMDNTILNEIEIRNLIYDKFKNIWTNNKINVVYDIFQELEISLNKNNNYEINSYVESLEYFINPIDKKVKDLLDKIT